MMHVYNLVAGVLCSFLAMGCGGSTSTTSRGADGAPGLNAASMKVGPRKVTVTADKQITTNYIEDVAIVGMDGRLVKIDFVKAVIAVDDKELAKLSAGAKLVEIRFVGGKLEFTVDGSTLTTPGTVN